MAGKDNLIPVNQRSKDEQRKIQSDGGKKSGETRRRQRDLRKAFEQVLKAKPNLSKQELMELQNGGYQGKGRGKSEYDVLMLSFAALAEKCKQGDVQAIRLMLEIMGQDARSMSIREQIEAKTAQPTPPDQSPAYTSFLHALNEKAGDAFDDDGIDGEDVPAGLDDTPNE